MKKIMRSIFHLDGDEVEVVDIKDKEKCPSFVVPENIEAWASTEIEKETFSFLWVLNNFSSFTSKNSADDEVESPVFKCGSKQSIWQLKIKAKNNIDNVDYLSIHLLLVSNNSAFGRKIKAKFQFSLLDVDGKPGQESLSPEFHEFYKKKGFCWGWDKYMPTNDVLNQEKLLEDDCLKIQCRIWIEGNLTHKTGVGRAMDKVSVSEDEIKGKLLRGLSDDLGKLLCSSEMADAHRMILAGRSPVFKRMLEIDMIESKTCSIDITDFDKEVVQGMLEYMYTGHTEILVKNAPELMQIAEKYDLGGLKEVCEIQMANNLSVENAVKVLVLAHLHNATVLKPAVINFINRHKDAVKKNKTFKDIAKANGYAFVDLYLSQL